MTSEAKQALWRKIQKEHRELADALKEAKARGEQHIGIDAYPVPTVNWIWGALKRQRPELCVAIAQQLRPMCDEFDGSYVEVPTEDLIEALMLDEDDGGQKKCRRAAA